MRAAVDRDALVVGMTLVPGLRGIVRQLSGAHGRVDELHVAHGGETVELRYRVPGLSVARRSTLTPLELACVRYLGGRAGIPGLHTSEEDRHAIDAALRRLASGLRLAEIDIGPAVPGE
jgi:hypothetical protein